MVFVRFAGRLKDDPLIENPLGCRSHPIVELKKGIVGQIVGAINSLITSFERG